MGNGSSSCLTLSVPNPYITISPCKSKSLSSSTFIPTISTNIIPQNFLLKIPTTMSNHSSPSNLTVKCGGGKSGTVPGGGTVHAPFALLPLPFPKSHREQACELAPVFNELVDRVSLDGKFLQDSLSRTKKVDAFTSRLLDIHSKMLELNKKEVGLFMNLLNHYEGLLGLDSKRVPANGSVNQFMEALALAWKEYNNPRLKFLKTNMYGQHWLSFVLKEKYPFTVLMIFYVSNAMIILIIKKRSVKFNP
ncbi:hypothetical protein MKX01_013770 [Papaver californicum]|nr:hypothetical protein MKX01_013770 [Papaver californicum]